MKTESEKKELRILILEDVPSDAALVELQLRRDGFTPTTRVVVTRETFVSELAAFAPDLVLSDYGLPDFDGLAAIELVRERFPAIPVIVVTGSINEETAVDCLKAGAVDYVLKDHLSRLGPAVRGALERKTAAAKAAAAHEQLRLQGAALAKSEERFRRLAENAPDVIYRYRLTPPPGFEYVSPACERLTGYTPEDYYADPDLGVRIVHPDDRHELTERRQNPEKYSETMVVRWITKEGGTVWAEQRAVPVFDAAGEIVAIEGIARDISETRRLGERLRQSERLESVGQLAGGVAHDFNNLLTVIMGNAEILLTGYAAGDPAAEGLEEIAATAQRAAALTRQLLAFSRKQELDPRVVDLNAVLTETRKMLARLIGEQIEMRWVLDPELGSVLVDPGQIEQVIVNLAVNGRDAMPRGGTLIVETANVDLDLTYTKAHGMMMPPGRYVKLAVSDSGTGMDQETLSKVFEPFFTTKELGHGTGLGLATVYGIVKQSGGFIWPYSEPDKGTTFKVYFPRVDERTETAEPPLPNSVKWRGGGETILLVEDETPLRSLVRRTLEKNGYHVLDAADSAAALQLWRGHNEEIRLLLSDVVIPGMSGPELARRLRKDSPEIRSLFFSGYTDDTMKRLGVTRENFIEKPFALKGLLSKVRNVLDSTPGSADVGRN